jgi:hypothetical protein
MTIDLKRGVAKEESFAGSQRRIKKTNTELVLSAVSR